MAVSSVVTGGVTISAVTLSPLVAWALNGFPQPVPDSVPLVLAAAIITVGHGAYNIVMARLNAKPMPPAAPAQGGQP